MIQLLRGVKHLHDNWILHRDLKTSNLLLSHAGILKVSMVPTCPLAQEPCPQPGLSRLCPCRWVTSGWLGSTAHP